MSQFLPDALPEGVRLVHIGPHKTGTTAVQYGFHRRREQVASYGVHYAGPDPQVYRPAVALTGLPGRLGARPARPQEWDDLVAEVRAAGEDRVVISSESFSNAEPAHIRRLYAELDPERVHVVRMVRRYDKLVPSQWQQQIAAGRTRTYESFLEQVVQDPRSRFWERHGFGPLTRRWADVVGPDRVSVVVVDESDRDWLLRVFECLVALPEGVLDRLEEDVTAGSVNRSLTSGEVEMLRTLNQFRGQSGWTAQTHQHLVRRGISPALRAAPPDPDGGRIATPASLYTFLTERTETDLAELTSLGVRVIGDPAWLDVPEPRGSSDQDAKPTLPLTSVVAAAQAVVRRRRQLKRFTLVKGGDLIAAQTPPPPRGQGAGSATRPEPIPGTDPVDVVPAQSDVAPDADDLVALGEAQSRLVTGFSAHDPAWVVVTLLPWDAALLSSWQTHLLAGGTETLEEWQSTWVAQDGPAEAAGLVRAAQQRVGSARVRAVVVDPRRAGALGRSLASVLGAEPRETGPGSRRVLTHAELAFLRDFSAGLTDAERGRFVAGAFAWMAAGNAPAHGVPVTDETRSALEAADAALVATGVALSAGRGLGRLHTGGELRLTPMTAARAVGGVISRTDDRTTT